MRSSSPTGSVLPGNYGKGIQSRFIQPSPPPERSTLKSTIGFVALIGALAFVLGACGLLGEETGSEPTIATPTESNVITPTESNVTTTAENITTLTTSTTAASSTSTTGASTTSAPLETALCSADGVVINNQQPQGDLPAEVAAMRTEILDAASSCDFDRLGDLAVANGTAYSFGGGSDPGGSWRDAEANGQKPLLTMVQLLNLPPVAFDVGEGNVFYVWPAVYALPNWSDATNAQRQELTDIFGADELVASDAFGSYIGYRLGITTDGRWTFFIAGD